MTVLLSVVIAATRAEALGRALNGLAAQDLPDGRLEVVVVHDSGFEMAPTPPNLVVHALVAEDPHPSSKRNQGAAAAAADILAFLDDDAIPPPAWASAALDLVEADSRSVWGGPNRDERHAWRFRLAQAVQQHPLLEGLVSHRESRLSEQAGAFLEVGIHDLPLCNLVVPKRLFEQLGGFAADISYFLDDVEFNYRAQQSGATLRLSPRLGLHHDLRPLIWPYLRYKFHTRLQVGRLYRGMDHLYADALQIKLIHLSWFLILPATVGLALRPVFVLWILGAYYAVALLAFGRGLRDPLTIVFGPLLLLAAHGMSYAGYTVGRLTSEASGRDRNDPLRARERR